MHELKILNSDMTDYTVWAGTQHFLQDRMCAQGRLGSACTSAQSDQAGRSLGCKGPKASTSGQRRLWSVGCAGWSVFAERICNILPNALSRLEFDLYIREQLRRWSYNDSNSLRWYMYSRTSITQTYLGLCKFVPDMGSSGHWGLFITPGQEANGYKLGMSFRSSVYR